MLQNRTVLKITALLLALLAVFAPIGAFAEESGDVSAPADTSAEQVPEPSTENVLVIKNLNTGNNLPLKAASGRSFETGVAARLMCALVAFEEIEDPAAKISVAFCSDDSALRGNGSYIGFSYDEADDAMNLEDFLTAALVSSAADACLTLAVAAMRHRAGESLDYSHNYSAAASAAMNEKAYLNDFVALMNERAKELGCKDTLFTSCTGLFDGASRTTAEDIAVIAAAVYANSALLAISDKASYTLSTGSNQIFTKNALKSEYNLKGYKLDGVKGITVGYIDKNDAFCTVTAAEKDGLSYVFVCVNATAAGGSGDSKYAPEISTYKTISDFLPWALSSFSYYTVVSPFTAVATVPVKAGKGRDSVTVVARDLIELLVTKDIDPENDISVVYTDISGLSLSAPVAEGQEVGRVYVYLKGELVGESPLVTNGSVAESSALSAVDKIKNTLSSDFMKKIYKWALILFAAYLAVSFVMFIYRVIRKYIDASRD